MRKKPKTKGKRPRTIPLSQESRAALQSQLGRFREKFGREPGPDDPIFFDPNADTPQPIDEAVINEEMVKAMNAAGIRPSLIYAWNKTGLLVTEENRHLIPEADLEEWQAAIEEYGRLQTAGKFN
jgi:hypothetical protein